MSFSKNLRQKRLEAGLTLEELAKKIETTKQTIQKYESGVIYNVPSDKIEKLAKALNTTPAVLMGWGDERKNINNKILSLSRLSDDGEFSDEEMEQLIDYAEFLIEKRKRNNK